MKEREALQEIINLYNSGLLLNKNTVKRCQQALEQSEPRMYEIQYGDGLKTKIEVSDSGIKVIAAVDGWGISVEDNEITIQSLSPKEVKPTQELQPKETIQAEKEGIKGFLNSHLVPLDIKSAQFHFNQGRTTTIQEIEKWVKENTESVENQSGDRGGAIWTSELLTKLQSLKK